MVFAVDLQTRPVEVQLDGEGLSARFRWRERPSRLAYSSQNERAEIAALELKQKANKGDAFAAFLLSELLSICALSYVGETDLQESVDLLLSSHLVKRPKSQKILQLAAPEQAQEYATWAIEQFETCKGISVKERAAAGWWLKRAADLGDPTAMMRYGYEMREKSVIEALDYLNRSWLAGDAYAPRLAAELFEENYDSNADEYGLVKAFANLLVHYKIQMAAHAGYNGQIFGREMQRVKVLLDGLGERMHLFEREQAATLAKEMIEMNSNCCYRY